MNKFINKFLLGLGTAGLLLGATSCDDPAELGKFEGPTFLALGKTAYSVSEASTTPITVQVGVASAPVKEAITINYTVSGTAVEGEDYTLSNSGTVTIPAGSSVGDIVITPVDNDIFNAAKTVVITLTSNSADMPMGLSGNTEKTKRNFTTVTITNNDCPVYTEIWTGDIEVDEPGYKTYGVTLAKNATGECNKLVVSNWWDSGLKVQVEFIPESTGAKKGTVVVARQKIGTYAAPHGDAYVVGEGEYDETTGIFWYDYTVTTNAGIIDDNRHTYHGNL